MQEQSPPDSIRCARCGHSIMRDARSPKRRWRKFGEATAICPEGGLHEPTLLVDWEDFDAIREEWGETSPQED